MKLLLPLLALSLFLTACANSNATRHGLYAPTKVSGPYTRSLENGTWMQNGGPVDEEMKTRREQQRIDAVQAKAPAKAE